MSHLHSWGELLEVELYVHICVRVAVWNQFLSQANISNSHLSIKTGTIGEEKCSTSHYFTSSSYLALSLQVSLSHGNPRQAYFVVCQVAEASLTNMMRVCSECKALHFALKRSKSGSSKTAVGQHPWTDRINQSGPPDAAEMAEKWHLDASELRVRLRRRHMLLWEWMKNHRQQS